MFDPKVMATINFAAQAVLLGVVLIAAYLVKIKKRFSLHCKIVRWAVVGQLLAIALIMLPSSLDYLKNSGAPLRTEIMMHNSLGFLTILLWGYINLAVTGKVRTVGRLAIYMRAALTLWLVTFLVGAHLYLRLYWLG